MCIEVQNQGGAKPVGTHPRLPLQSLQSPPPPRPPRLARLPLQTLQSPPPSRPPRPPRLPLQGGTSEKSPTSTTSTSDIAVDDFHGGYVLGKKLGRGTFGQVRTATPVKDRSRMNEASVAVKILDLRDKDDRAHTEAHREAHTEASVWHAVKHHKHILHLHDVVFDASCCYYVMEECSGLFQHLKQMPTLDERSVGKVLAQMFLGIAHVHSVGVVHRDVKPDNFLVGGSDGVTVKLCDFGLSATLPEGGKLKGVRGTAPFMCPEMLQGRMYDVKADVWSMAVIAYVLLLGDFPYSPKAKSAKAFKQATIEGKPPKFQPVAPFTQQKRSESALEFVKTLLNREPGPRPFASETLKLPYMLASMDDSHMAQTGLLSLLPMLDSARDVGAFQFRDVKKQADLDVVLNDLQLEKQGAPLPEEVPAKPLESPNFIAKAKQAAALAVPMLGTMSSKLCQQSVGEFLKQHFSVCQHTFQEF